MVLYPETLMLLVLAMTNPEHGRFGLVITQRAVPEPFRSLSDAGGCADCQSDCSWKIVGLLIYLAVSQQNDLSDIMQQTLES